MSANFYDNAGVMGGIDYHEFFMLIPPGLTIPIKLFPHIVSAPFFWPTATFWKRTGTVKSDNWQMIQGSFDLYLVPHIPMPLPWAPTEPVQLLKVTASAGSKAQLTAHSVTGEGNALATCIAGPFGLNVNCQEFGLSAPTGVVFNLNSVQTSPTAGDYAGAFLGYVVDAALGWALEGGLGRLTGNRSQKWKFAAEIVKHLWRRTGDIPVAKTADIPSHVQNFVQRFIDSGPSEAINGLSKDPNGG